MSLRTIEASLYARLQTLLTTASPAGYVAAVVRVAGDRETQAKLEQDAQITSNLVALALDRRTPVSEVNVRRGAAQQIIFAARWRVVIVVRNQVTHEHALATANTGVYALMDAVTEALSGFKCAGLWPRERVRPSPENGDIKHRPGRYVATLYFETRYAVHAAETTVTTEEPLLVHGDINLIPAADTAPNPLTEVEAP